MTAPVSPGLVRSIGRWSLAALVLNGIIGSGVFALPGTVADKLGWLAIPAWIGAGFVALAIIMSFAEVASRFDRAGGPYLYAQAAYGRFVGLQMAWMALFVRLISAAVQINLLNTYLAGFWTPAGTRVGGAVTSAVLLGFLAWVNFLGVKGGTGTSNFFSVVKLTSLAGFAALGIAWIAAGKTVTAPLATANTPDGWLNVLLLLMFAYGGFEAALIPMAEAKDPRRDAPFALLVGLGAVAVAYVLVQVVVVATLSDPAANDRPLAAAARVMMGESGAVLMTIAAMLSVYGWTSGGMLNIPRLTMAMADSGDLPKPLGRIHPRYHTPYVSIVGVAVAIFLLSLQGSLLQNISLATVSRMITYGLVCATVLTFRRWDRLKPGVVGEARFRAPAGQTLAILGIAVSLVLVVRMNLRELLSLGAVVAVAALHWGVVRGRPGRAA
ncbi:MAG TPA: APC family permease [Gemmatimonadales bacterium]